MRLMLALSFVLVCAACAQPQAPDLPDADLPPVPDAYPDLVALPALLGRAGVLPPVYDDDLFGRQARLEDRAADLAR